MKRLLFLFLFLVFSNFFLYSEEYTAAELHFGLGFEISSMGIGATSSNSFISKIGSIGYGGTAGVGWGLFDFFSESFMMPFFWSVFTSYEYPGWFGVFFSYGWYNKKYPYIYRSGISYSGDTINMYDHAAVDRNYIAFGLQKTFYTSYYQKRWEYIPGSYIGDPSTWRSGYWQRPGTYHFSLNIQAGARYNMKHNNIEHSNYFVPIDVESLYNSIIADDNKFSFFIGIKANYDFPVTIKGKSNNKGSEVER